jgi:hypothetical protein
VSIIKIDLNKYNINNYIIFNIMEEQIKIGFTGNRYGLNSEQKVQIISILDKYDNSSIFFINDAIFNYFYCV